MTRPPGSDPPGGARTRDNADIEADRQAFIDAYGRARKQFAKFKGVTAVGFGLKITGSKITDDVAIVVHVRAKKSADKLSSGERIPESFEGYRTDVRQSAAIRLTDTSCDNDQSYPTIQGGIQIEPWASTAPLTQGPRTGTLGCLVRKRNNTSDDNWYALTCQHVVFDDQALKTKDRDGLYHPYKPRKDYLGIDRKGILLGPLNSFDSESAVVDDFFMDAAVVRLDIGSTCFGSSCGTPRLTTATTIINLNVTGQAFITPQNRNQITDVRDVYLDSSIVNQQVFKVGRTTGRTVGRVLGVNASADDTITITLDDGTQEVLAAEPRPNCIEILLDGVGNNCQHKDCFGWDGDSGAVVVDGHNAVIGIFFARGENPDPQTGRYHSFACHIVPVLDHLRVCVPVPAPPVGGTNHGTTNATDGSGLTAAKTKADLGAETTDGVTFVSLMLQSRQASDPDRAGASSLTQAQQARLTTLRDALRGTDRGRALDDALTEMSREIAYLVRRCRPVTVVWHRNRGPAFLARALNHLRGDANATALEIDGVSRAQLLARMRAILDVNGSNPLRDSLARWEVVLPMLSEASTAEAFIDALRRWSSVESIEV